MAEVDKRRGAPLPSPTDRSAMDRVEADKRRAAAKPTLDVEKTVVKFKTKICIYFLQPSGCPYGDRCLYAHGALEMREDMAGGTPSLDIVENPKLKTRMCRHWLSSNGTSCPHGIRCTYAHGPSEMDRYIKVPDIKPLTPTATSTSSVGAAVSAMSPTAAHSAHKHLNNNVTSFVSSPLAAASGHTYGRSGGIPGPGGDAAPEETRRVITSSAGRTVSISTLPVGSPAAAAAISRPPGLSVVPLTHASTILSARSKAAEKPLVEAPVHTHTNTTISNTPVGATGGAMSQSGAATLQVTSSQGVGIEQSHQQQQQHSEEEGGDASGSKPEREREGGEEDAVALSPELAKALGLGSGVIHTKALSMGPARPGPGALKDKNAKPKVAVGGSEAAPRPSPTSADSGSPPPSLTTAGVTATNATNSLSPELQQQQRTPSSGATTSTSSTGATTSQAGGGQTALEESEAEYEAQVREYQLPDGRYDIKRMPASLLARHLNRHFAQARAAVVAAGVDENVAAAATRHLEEFVLRGGKLVGITSPPNYGRAGGGYPSSASFSMKHAFAPGAPGVSPAARAALAKTVTAGKVWSEVVGGITPTQATAPASAVTPVVAASAAGGGGGGLSKPILTSSKPEGTTTMTVKITATGASVHPATAIKQGSLMAPSLGSEDGAYGGYRSAPLTASTGSAGGGSGGVHLTRWPGESTSATSDDGDLSFAVDTLVSNVVDEDEEVVYHDAPSHTHHASNNNNGVHGRHGSGGSHTLGSVGDLASPGPFDTTALLRSLDALSADPAYQHAITAIAHALTSVNGNSVGGHGASTGTAMHNHTHGYSGGGGGSLVPLPLEMSGGHTASLELPEVPLPGHGFSASAGTLAPPPLHTGLGGMGMGMGSGMSPHSSAHLSSFQHVPSPSMYGLQGASGYGPGFASPHNPFGLMPFQTQQQQQHLTHMQVPQYAMMGHGSPLAMGGGYYPAMHAINGAHTMMMLPTSQAMAPHMSPLAGYPTGYDGGGGGGGWAQPGAPMYSPSMHHMHSGGSMGGGGSYGGPPSRPPSMRMAASGGSLSHEEAKFGGSMGGGGGGVPDSRPFGRTEDEEDNEVTQRVALWGIGESGSESRKAAHLSSGLPSRVPESAATAPGSGSNGWLHAPPPHTGAVAPTSTSGLMTPGGSMLGGYSSFSTAPGSAPLAPGSNGLFNFSLPGSLFPPDVSAPSPHHQQAFAAGGSLGLHGLHTHTGSTSSTS